MWTLDFRTYDAGTVRRSPAAVSLYAPPAFPPWLLREASLGIKRMMAVHVALALIIMTIGPLVAPFAADAQPAPKVPRVGVFFASNPTATTRNSVPSASHRGQEPRSVSPLRGFLRCPSTLCVIRPETGRADGLV